MQNKKFINFLYTPAGVCDGILAVAASRAGGVGILNTELFGNTDSVVDQLAFLASNTSGNYGLKIWIFHISAPSFATPCRSPF